MSYGNPPLPGDYHIHPDFSFDSKASIDILCEAAIKRGLTEICFTTHYEADPKTPERHRTMKIDGKVVPSTIENMKAYVDAVTNAHEKYYSQGLMVRCGVELGYFDGCRDEYEKLISTYDFYFKIGSVHMIENLDICIDREMHDAPSKYPLDRFADLVYSELIKTAECGLFDTLGHLDMYKKYGLKYYGEEINKIHRGRIEPLFDALIKTGTGVEINTSALRKGHSEYYPSMEIINLARAAGVTITSIGSDAHRPEEIGWDFEMAAAVAHELTPYCDE